MDVQNIEKLNQLISRNDMTGNEKVEWLIAFTENYQALQLHKANVSSCCDMSVCMKLPKCSKQCKDCASVQ